MTRSLLLVLVVALACVAGVSAKLPAEAVVASEALLADAALVQQGDANHLGLESKFNSSDANGWVLYKQCGGNWANNRLGTSGVTICQAGCAMTSVAMALRTRGSNLDPGSYNQWLTNNGGYVSGNLLVWGAANAWGTIKLQNYYSGYGSVGQGSLQGMISRGQPVVVNVRSGGHWVLVTGYGGGNTYLVNDSGFNVGSYQYGDMSNFVVYA